MPSGRHKAVLDGLKSVLAAMNGAPTYNYDYTAAGAVTFQQPGEDLGNHPIVLWVHAGLDEWQFGGASPRSFEVFFHPTVTVFVGAHDEAVSLTEKLEFVRFDVLTAALNNPMLGGTCSDSYPLRSSETVEDTNSKRGAMDIELVARLSDVSKAML